MSIDITEQPSHSHSFSVLLPLKDWQSMKKIVSYKLYLDLNQKLESKECFIEKFKSSYQKELLEVRRQPGGSSSWADESSDATPEQVTVSKAKVTFAETVREFEAIEHKNDQVNIVLGSNIASKLEIDATIPSDCGIHAYRESTTKKKKLLEKYKV